MSGQDLDERVDAYLDGLMSRDETRAFEAELVAPDVAAALSEALLLRELLAHPDAADELPEGLVARIEEALGVDEQAARTKVKRFARLRAALSGAGWSVRGPALAVAPAGDTLGAASGAAKGAAKGATRSVWRLLRKRGG